jgi:hypothetical protein
MSLCIMSVLALGFFMTKRAHDNMNAMNNLISQGDCLDQAARIADELDRTVAMGVCFDKAGGF